MPPALLQLLSHIDSDSGYPVVITGDSGAVQWANAAFIGVMGYSKLEVLGKSIPSLLDCNSLGSCLQIICQACPSSKGRGKTRCVVHTKKRVAYWTNVTVEPFQSVADESGPLMVYTFTDLSQKQLWEDRQTSQVRFLRKMDDWASRYRHQDDLPHLLNALQEWLEFDKLVMAFFRSSGMEALELEAGDPIHRDGLHKDPMAEWVKTVGHSCHTDDLIGLKQEYSRFHYQYLGVPMMAGDSCVGVIGGYYQSSRLQLTKNIEDLIQMSANSLAWLFRSKVYQQELEQALDRLNRSQLYANIGSWEWSIASGDMICTPQVRSLFGFNVTEKAENYGHFLQKIHPDDRKSVVNAINRCLLGERDLNIDFRVLWQDGEPHWVNCRGNVKRNDENYPEKMFAVTQSIQLVKDSEAKLVLAQHNAERANKAKSEFLSSMSHELRTPLNSILGFAQLLQSSDLNSDQQENVEIVLRSGQLLLGLVNDVLDLAKLEAGVIQVQSEPVNIPKLFEQCLSMLANDVQLKGIQVEHCCAQEIRPVMGDSLRLKQVLLNLLSNAVKYNRPGGKVTLRCNPAEQDRLRLTVSDTGYGIPDNKKQHIGVPFNRLGYENSSIDGVGVGLVITRRLIESMGGVMGFESVEGAGSDFWVEIPLGQGQAGRVGVGDNIALGGERISPQSDLAKSEPPPRTQCLYVEDNLQNRLLMRKILQRQEGFVLFEADTISEGLRMARLVRPDVVLLDLQLPDGDGALLCRRLRGWYGSEIPIIAVTADARVLPQAKGRYEGFDAIIHKPFDLNGLITCLQQVIGDKLKNAS